METKNITRGFARKKGCLKVLAQKGYGYTAGSVTLGNGVPKQKDIMKQCLCKQRILMQIKRYYKMLVSLFVAVKQQTIYWAFLITLKTY